MENWRIAALIGTIVFLFSAFLPFLSAGFFGLTLSLSLADIYRLVAQAGTPTQGSAPVPSGVYGLFLAMIMYPVAVVLGFASYVHRKLTLAAGILGIVCWLGAVWAVADMNTYAMGLIRYDAGIYVGMTGAIFLFVAYFLKTSEAKPQPAPLETVPKPPPQSTSV